MHPTEDIIVATLAVLSRYTIGEQSQYHTFMPKPPGPLVIDLQSTRSPVGKQNPETADHARSGVIGCLGPPESETVVIPPSVLSSPSSDVDWRKGRERRRMGLRHGCRVIEDNEMWCYSFALPASSRL